MAGAGIRIHTRGPLFDGRWRPEMRHIRQKVEEKLAKETEAAVEQRLGRVLKHPTGHYMSQIDVRGPHVTDGGVVYGPWLEGVGSRNRTTRFKGYFTFRQTAQEMQKRAVGIAEGVIRSNIGRLR
jgi:hypothetical protein